MKPYRRFRAAERLALFGLSRLGVELSVPSPLDPTLPFLRDARLVEEHLGNAQLEQEVARHDLLVTANCRSVLAARAAAMGVPLALVDPANLPSAGGYDPATQDLLAEAAAEETWPGPMPLELRAVRCGDADATVTSFRALQRDLGEMRELQIARCVDYERLPSALACIEQVLAA